MQGNVRQHMTIEDNTRQDRQNEDHIMLGSLRCERTLRQIHGGAVRIIFLLLSMTRQNKETSQDKTRRHQDKTTKQGTKKKRKKNI